MDRKTEAFTGKLPCPSPSRTQFSSKETPPQKPLCEKFSTKKMYTGEIMSVSAVPNAESNNDLVLDNPNSNL